MKKIILILFLFSLCISCYYIYKLTDDTRLTIAAIGDSIGNINKIRNEKNIKNFNNQFINKQYMVKDILNVVKYNEEKIIDNKNLSIHKILKESDILIISVGMNDIYYKLNDSTKEIYTYLNEIINNYEELLKEVSKYNYRQVYILGYYNITNKNNDIFTYINYKLKKTVDKYKYTYIELSDVLYNNKNYYKTSNKYDLNNEGYAQILKIIVEKIKKT